MHNLKGVANGNPVISNYFLSLGSTHQYVADQILDLSRYITVEDSHVTQKYARPSNSAVDMTIDPLITTVIQFEDENCLLWLPVKILHSCLTSTYEFCHANQNLVYK